MGAMEPMSRQRRTRILVLSPPELRQTWAEQIRRSHNVEILEPSRAGLVLVQVRESARRTAFSLGEVLVTEAKARVAGSPGLGLLRGWDETGAEDLAVIDAACRSGVADWADWGPRLAAAEGALETLWADERRRLSATRVDFQTLDQETP